MTQDEFGFNAHRRGTAIFALSFRHSAMLDEAIIRGGWAIWSMVPRDGEHPSGDMLVSAFLASEARVALIDARGEGDAGLRAAQALGAVIAATGAAMLVSVPDSAPTRWTRSSRRGPRISWNPMRAKPWSMPR